MPLTRLRAQLLALTTAAFQAQGFNDEIQVYIRTS
jgi:hypothetical protein